MGSQSMRPESLAAPAHIAMFGGPLDWSEAWYSRHQLTAGLARSHRVLLIDPPRELRSALSAPATMLAGPRLEREPVGTFRYAHPGWLPAVHRSPFLARTTARLRAAAVIRQLGAAGKGGSIAYVWHPDHADEVMPLGSLPFVYHAYDRYDLYTGAAAEDARRRETWLARNAAFCVGASSMIVEHLRSLGAEDVRLLRHGVDPGFFDRDVAIPADLERLPRPRIGLVASLSDAVDYLGLTRIAQERPGWSLVIVGKQAFTDERKRAQYDALTKLPNVHAFGFRPQKEVPGWLKGFDAALISYDLATWAPYNQPLKLYEYLASGTPVVASRIQAAEELGELVATVATEEAWIPAIEGVLSRDDGPARDGRRRFADENRWERRVATLDDWLAKRFGVPDGDAASARRGG
ncbi:MAG: glycosyltransferase [Myxococcota bacterium]